MILGSKLWRNQSEQSLYISVHWVFVTKLALTHPIEKKERVRETKKRDIHEELRGREADKESGGRERKNKTT